MSVTKCIKNQEFSVFLLIFYSKHESLRYYPQLLDVLHYTY